MAPGCNNLGVLLKKTRTFTLMTQSEYLKKLKDRYSWQQLADMFGVTRFQNLRNTTLTGGFSVDIAKHAYLTAGRNLEAEVLEAMMQCERQYLEPGNANKRGRKPRIVIK